MLHRMGIASTDAASTCSALGSISDDSALIIDGLIGYSLQGPPRGLIGDLIRLARQAFAPVLSLDVPSGIDAGSGETFDPAISATATMTLALPKRGLIGHANVGELYLADITVPPRLYGEPPLGLEVAPIFASSDIVRIV